MSKVNHLISKAKKRATRVRAKLHGSASRPRITINRSNAHIYVQAIDDDSQKTLAFASDIALKTGTKIERSAQTAEQLFTQLQKQKVTAGVFDRGHYKYHGRVKAIAEKLRELGLAI